MRGGIAHQRSAARMIVDADKHPVAGRPGAGDGMRLHVGQQLVVNPLGRAPQRSSRSAVRLPGEK